jgi:hypothetical protein
MMLDELQRRNYSQSTVRSYIHVIEDFSKHFHRSPDRLGPDHIRQYQAHLFRDRKFPGFREFQAARRTIQGYEAVHMIRKGQVRWVAGDDLLRHIRFPAIPDSSRMRLCDKTAPIGLAAPFD